MDDNERIDKVLSELDKNKIGLVDVQKFLVNELKDNDLRSYQRIIREIVNQRFAKQQSGLSTVCEILPDGREIVKAGGYIKHLERRKAAVEEEVKGRKTTAAQGQR